MSGIDHDDRLRALDEVHVMGRGVQVGGTGVGHGYLSGLVEVDAEAGAGIIPEREPADAGMAAVLLRADVRHHLVVTVEVQRPTSPERRRSG